MSTRTEYPNFVGNTGKFLKVNATETDVLWDAVDASDITGVLGIDHGGTGADNANDALNNLLPDQAGHVGEVLHTDGTDTYWSAAGVGSGVDTREYQTSGNIFPGSTQIVGGIVGGKAVMSYWNMIDSDPDGVPFYDNVIVKKLVFRTTLDLPAGAPATSKTADVYIYKNGAPTGYSQTLTYDSSASTLVEFNLSQSFASTDKYSIRFDILNICRVNAPVITGTFTIGETVTQASSGVSGIVVAQGSQYIIVEDATGIFDLGANPIIGGTSGASATNPSSINYATQGVAYYTITQVSGGSPLGVQSVTGTGVDNTDPFNPVVRTASTSQEGTLSAADWNTFNGKQNALPSLCVVKAYKNLLGGAASPFIADTEVFDTTNSYDNTTGIFTAPRAGYYLITGVFSVEGHTVDPSIASVQIIKNGSTTIDDDSVRFNGTEGSSDFWKRRLKVFTTTNLAAGETIQFNVTVNTGTITITGGVSGNQITISELR